MTTYHIPTGYITVSCDTVLETPSCLELYLSKPWETLRLMLEQNGIEIEPIITESRSEWVRVKGILYELRWSDNHNYLKRISKHVDGKVTDISYNSLPPLIRNALQ
jgi:hypothetical protein